jgi:CubicO group peptidase (beta-lactamase class C family)
MLGGLGGGGRVVLFLLPPPPLLVTACGGDGAARRDGYPHAAEPIGTVREIYDGTLTPELAVNTFRNIDRLFPTRTVAPSAVPLPLPASASLLGEVRIVEDGRTYGLEDYLELNRIAGLLVLKDGAVVLERYRFGNGPRTRWMSMSVAKSITSTLVGAAVHEGYITSLDDAVTRYVPGLEGSAYDGVTVREVLTMTSGVRWTEAYSDPASDRRRLLEAQIAQEPGAALTVMRELPRAAPPGTRYNYSTGETQVAAEIVRGAVGRTLAEYLSERIWGRAGMEHAALWWLDSPDGTEIGGSGFSATLRDYGRFGLFVLGGGMADGERILPDGWAQEAGAPSVLHDGTPVDYGYLWWTAGTPLALAHGAFTAEGIHGQFLHIDPVANVVIVVWGARPRPLGGEVIDDRLFLEAVVQALTSPASPPPDPPATRAAPASSSPPARR